MTIETEKFLTVRLGHARRDEFCETCDSKTPLLTVAETAKFAGTNPRTIYRLIGEGQLHFRETAAGLLLVCFDSFSTKQQPSAKE